MEEVYATFGGSASLLDFLDGASLLRAGGMDGAAASLHLGSPAFAERVLVVLQDGRHLVGILRSYDQFCA